MVEERLSGEVLQELLDASPRVDGMLSVYLNTGPGRVAGQAYLLAYRDACKQLRQELPASEHERFELAEAQAEAHLTGPFAAGKPGVALFVDGSGASLRAVSLPAAPGDAIHWGERPYVEPLQSMLDDEERVAVALIDQEQARLFTIFLGAIETEQSIQDDVPGKQRTGGWFALAQTRYERHREAQVLRHVKRTLAALTTLLRTRPFDRLFLSGPDEALALVEHHLPRPLRVRLAGTLDLELFTPDAVVLAAALKAAESVERHDELASVNELINGATTPRVALGIDQTLAAISDGRVHRLLVARTFALPGAECADCGRLVSTTAGPCPVCAAQLAPCADLHERVVERAMAQGAKVEAVEGGAQERLLKHGGLGAWTRYAPQQEI